MREAMEMDFSNWNIPPLYIGGNVGYSWLDGKEDFLEAPVELMDRMVNNANNIINEKKEFPLILDPREYWREEIIKYNLEVLDTQSKTGYIDPDDPEEKRILPIHNIDDALKSVRIAKYATHDSFYSKGKSRGVFILGMVMLKGHEAIWNDFYNILEHGEEISIHLLNQAKDKFSDYEEARNSLALRTSAEWFGFSGYGGDILNFAVTKGNIKEISFKSEGSGSLKKNFCLITDMNDVVHTFEKSQFKLTPPEKVLVGQELVEKERTVLQELENIFSIEETRKVLKIKTDTITPQTLEKIIDLLSNVRNLNSLLKDPSHETYSLGLYSENDSNLNILPFREMPVEFVPIVKELLRNDLLGIDDFDNLNKKVLEIAQSIF